MLLSDTGASFAKTTVTQLRDYPEWHRGRRRYAIWMIPINCPSVLAYIDQVTASLADLLHPSRRQPHITLFVCGFEGERVRYDDDFTPVQLQRQLADLDRLELRPCELPIGAPDSFASAAFLPVGDPEGHLACWREALAVSCKEIRQAAYVPRITLGLYRRAVRAQELRQRLAQRPIPGLLSLPVKRLEYATYASDDMFGPLACRDRKSVVEVKT